MSNLKTRIEALKAVTADSIAINICNEAITQLSKYDMYVSPVEIGNVENVIAESIIEKLSDVNDSEASKFLTVEKRILGINNLGVKKLFSVIKNSEISQRPPMMYVVERSLGMEHSPEWLVADNMLESFKAYAYEPDVKSAINMLEQNCKKYAEDIKIYKAVYEARNSRSSYVMSGLEKDVDLYLNERTTERRSELLEKLDKFSYDPGIYSLYKVISESASEFYLKGSPTDAYTSKVYSPVIIAENSEIFAVHGKAYIKSGTKIRPLTESEVEKLPSSFNFISSYLQESNVEISNNKVKILSHDKKVELVEESDKLAIYINEKQVSRDNFHSVYLNSGIFRFDEKDMITAINHIIESWDTIFELDFVTSIMPKDNPNRRADVFCIGESVYVYTLDNFMGEGKFYADCNATQGRNLVLEFANYDLGNALAGFIASDEVVIKKLEEKKRDHLDAIEYLETKKSMLESLDIEIRESDEVSQLLQILDEEISNAKGEYFNTQNEITKLTNPEYVNEGINAGDCVEVEKKKQ